jgi:hypothetical protein
MLAWLSREGWLEVRVGVMRLGGGILHAKFGLFTDAGGESLVFAGSDNESAQGVRGNFEILESARAGTTPSGTIGFAANLTAFGRVPTRRSKPCRFPKLCTNG